ncbi:MAG TPA: magnesium transporter [Pirellulales bacterium]
MADLLDELSEEEDQAVFRLLHGPQRVRAFEYLDRAVQRRILTALPDDDAASLLNGMAADDRTALLEDLDEPDRERALRLLSDKARAVAEQLLEYPEESVGRLMTTSLVSVRPHWTIAHALDHIRRHGQDSETLNVLYVVDAEDKLVDDLRIRQVLLAAPNQTIQSLMDGAFVVLLADAPKRSAVEVFQRYDRSALPVVDAEGRLLGVVTIDDVLDVAEQAATEDIQKFGGMEALSEPYASTPILTMVRKRGVWLVVLFLGEMLTATAMGYYEHQIAQAVVLALFVPLIISSGGNSGSQAATLIVRALAVGDVQLRDWPQVLGRELLSGALLGVLLGAIGFARIALWSAFTDVYGPHWTLVGATVGLSLVGIVLWGAVAGSMLPFALKRLGLDPATSSAPFVATLVDVTGLIIYFTVATIVLRGTLL